MVSVQQGTPSQTNEVHVLNFCIRWIIKKDLIYFFVDAIVHYASIRVCHALGFLQAADIDLVLRFILFGAVVQSFFL